MSGDEEIRYWDPTISVDKLSAYVSSGRLDLNAKHSNHSTFFDFMCARHSIGVIRALFVADPLIRIRRRREGDLSPIFRLMRYNSESVEVNDALIFIVTRMDAFRDLGPLLQLACEFCWVRLARQLIVDFKAHVGRPGLYHSLATHRGVRDVVSIARCLYDNGYRDTKVQNRYPCSLAIELAIERRCYKLAEFLAPFADLRHLSFNPHHGYPSIETLVCLFERALPVWMLNIFWHMPSHCHPVVPWYPGCDDAIITLYEIFNAIYQERDEDAVSRALELKSPDHRRRVITRLLNLGVAPTDAIRDDCPDALLPWEPKYHRVYFCLEFEERVVSFLIARHCAGPLIPFMPDDVARIVISFIFRRTFVW